MDPQDAQRLNAEAEHADRVADSAVGAATGAARKVEKAKAHLAACEADFAEAERSAEAALADAERVRAAADPDAEVGDAGVDVSVAAGAAEGTGKAT